MMDYNIRVACPGCGWDNDGEACLVQAYDSSFVGITKSYALSTEPQFDPDTIFTQCPNCDEDAHQYYWISAAQQQLPGIETLIKKIRLGEHDERLEEFANAVKFREQQREQYEQQQQVSS